MTDLGTLRHALRAQQDLDPDGRATPDLGDIMARGRRLRLRRRLIAVGGAVCAAAVVFGVVSGISQLTRPSPAPAQRPAGSTRIMHPPSPRYAHASTPAPVPSRGNSPVTRSPTPPSQTASVSPTPTPGHATSAASPISTPSGAISTASPTSTPSGAASSVG
jgi:hypothetical protein